MVPHNADADIDVDSYSVESDQPDIAAEPYEHAKRVAGAMICLSSAVAVMAAIAAQEPGESPGFAPLVIDMIIGFALIKGDERLVFWAILRVIVGFVFSVVMMTSAVELIFSLPLTTGLLLLLIGEPTKKRTLLGAAAVIAPLLLLIGFMAFAKLA